MSDILSPELDTELFGDSIDLELHRAFDIYAMVDPEVASSDSVELPTKSTNDLPRTNIGGVTLSDIEGPEEAQGTESAAVPTPASSDDLPGDLFDATFSSEVEAGEGLHRDIFGWSPVDTMEHPVGLQGVDWATPPASEDTEGLQGGSCDEGLAGARVTEVPEGTPSREELMAEIARLSALVGSQNASPNPVQMPSVHSTAVEQDDSVNTHFDQLFGLCNMPVQLSPVKFDFSTDITQGAPTFPLQSEIAHTEEVSQDEELSLENALLLRNLMEGAAQYEQQILAQNAQSMQPACSPPAPTFMAPMPQASRHPSFPQHQQGTQLEHGSYMYSPASNNGINAMSPPQFPTSSPAAISNTSTPKSKTSRRAPRAPAKRRPASASKVTKATKKTHQRTSSAPASHGRQRSLEELYAARFFDLDKDEKARLLLPLLQGIDPVTGLVTGRPGTLGMASSLSAFNQGMNNFNTTPATGMGGNISTKNNIYIGMTQGMGMAQGTDNYMGMSGGGFDMDNGVNMGNGVDLNAFNMVQQAAGELNSNNYGMARQNEALERAAMLRAAGRRR